MNLLSACKCCQSEEAITISSPGYQSTSSVKVIEVASFSAVAANKVQTTFLYFPWISSTHSWHPIILLPIDGIYLSLMVP